jgi:hypothetical protein
MREHSRLLAALPVNATRAPYIWKLANSGRMSNAYGLFRSMTGVGRDGRSVARPELVLYGRHGAEEPWLEMPFSYKPGANSFVAPKWVAPHQPRLDWQMWFAALAPSINQSGAPWLITLVSKLLAGSPAVYALLAPGNFSASAPPSEIKILQHTARFSALGSNAWWVHEGAHEWLQPVRDSHIPLEFRGLTLQPARYPWLTGGVVPPAACAALGGLFVALATRSRRRIGDEKQKRE